VWLTKVLYTGWTRTFGTRHRYVMAMITVVDTPAIVATVFNRRFAARAIHVVQPDWSCTWTIPSSNHPPAVVPKIDNLKNLAPYNGPYKIYSNGTDNIMSYGTLKWQKMLLPEPSSQQKSPKCVYSQSFAPNPAWDVYILQYAWFGGKGIPIVTRAPSMSLYWGLDPNIDL